MIDIQASFMVSAPEAFTTFDSIFLPVFFSQKARAYFAIILAIRTTIVAGEYSGASASEKLSIDSIIICMPAAIIISAIIIVVARSIFSRCWLYFLLAASFSLMMTSRPEMPSIRLCKASDIMANEFDKTPTMTLKIASSKLVIINKIPDLTIMLLRLFSIVIILA